MASEAERRLLLRWRDDPHAFFVEGLGAKPWSAQVAIAESVRDNAETAVKSCHGVGKDWTAARVALWFLISHPNSLVITTAPTDRQVKGILWKEISIAHENARFSIGGRLLTQELHLARGWSMLGFTSASYNPDRFQGWHAVDILVVLDEASGISKEIYTGVDGVLTSAGAKRIEIGNPTDPASEFAKSFKTPGVSKLSIDVFSTPNFEAFGITEQDLADDTWEEKVDGREMPCPWLVTPVWASKKYKRWGPENALYRSRVMAEFPRETPDQLIPMARIEAAQNRTLVPEEPVVLGVDVARYGDDKSQIYCRRGDVLRHVSEHSKTATTETTGHVLRALRMTKAERAQVDVIGIGSGVVDQLREQGVTVTEVNAGAAPNDKEHHANVRAEMYWNLRDRFESGDIDIAPGDEDLAAELSDIRWKPDSRGRVTLESKDEMKRRLGRSPDRADAAAIAFVVPKERRAMASPTAFGGVSRPSPWRV